MTNPRDPANPIKICYLPGRESGYSRTRVLLKAMKDAGIVVFDCSSPKTGPTRYLHSFSKFLRNKRKSDVILIGFLGHFFVPIAKLLTRKRILFDAFISVYQTLAFDRCSIPLNSIRAHLARWIDRLSCRLADHIFLDTQAHIDYFVKEFDLDRNKFSRLWVSSDDSVMYPRLSSGEQDKFIVHFHGEFQELHGAEHIVEAAQYFPDLQFQMIGKGRTLSHCKELAQKLGTQNVTFLPPVPYTELPDHISKASICLGVFGTTQKANMVIPHKIFEALALGKPVITMDSPAIRELLTHERDVYLCGSGSAKDVGEAIAALHKNRTLLGQIGRQGHKIFTEVCSPKIIGKTIYETTERLLNICP